ncbi:MAG: aspartate aminotransferase family protein [Bacteroidales bacterium]|nr:MAG: aspartate aminotransferase family protein [Bacteroidales bacterium]
MKKNNKKFPSSGTGSDNILSAIKKRKSKDIKWDSGKMFGFVYHPGDEISQFIEQVYNLYFYENALNPSLFPSIREFENEIVSMTASLLNAGDDFAGNITSGGTESIFLAIKTARDISRQNKPHIKNPEIIVPVTAHPAFNKAAHYLGIKVIPVLAGEDKRVDLDALKNAISSSTILIACSAPTFPHGVVDPVDKIAQLALEHNIFCHVDACLGGFMLPFIEKMDFPVPLYDFRIPGVTSISADAHKYGYAPKGVSIIIYRDSKIRKQQFFVHTDWPGGIFGTPCFQGTRSAASVVSFWALVHLLGMKGYLELAGKTMEAAKFIMKNINRIPGLKIISNPEMSVFAFTSDHNDIYLIADEMASRGWHLDRQQFPESLHMTITHSNTVQAEPFIKDLLKSVNKVRKSGFHKVSSSIKVSSAQILSRILPSETFRKITRSGASGIHTSGKNKPSKSAVIYGIAASFENRKDVRLMILDLLDQMYRL